MVTSSRCVRSGVPYPISTLQAISITLGYHPESDVQTPQAEVTGHEHIQIVLVCKLLCYWIPFIMQEDSMHCNKKENERIYSAVNPVICSNDRLGKTCSLEKIVA